MAMSAVVRGLDVRLDPAKSSPGTLLEGQRDRGPKRLDSAGQHFAGNPDIHQRTEQHVPGDAGGQVKIENAHGNGGF